MTETTRCLCKRRAGSAAATRLHTNTHAASASLSPSLSSSHAVSDFLQLFVSFGVCFFLLCHRVVVAAVCVCVFLRYPHVFLSPQLFFSSLQLLCNLSAPLCLPLPPLRRPRSVCVIIHKLQRAVNKNIHKSQVERAKRSRLAVATPCRADCHSLPPPCFIYLPRSLHLSFSLSLRRNEDII